MIKDFQRNRMSSLPTAGSGLTSGPRAAVDSSQSGGRPLTPSPAGTRLTGSIQCGARRSGATHSGHPPWHDGQR